MRANKVKALWKQGKPVAVGWVSSADTYVAEVLANAGFDALVLDMQHGMGIGPDRAALWLQAVSTTNTVPMVRVPWNEPWYMQWVLDAGAYGVIVPLVNSREEAAKAGGACRYPPLGYRSMGPNRARLYGGVDYFQNANQEIACLVMVEDLRTVDQIDELAKAPGIDGFYIGPADLAISMGVAPGGYRQDERHAAACRRVAQAAKASGLVAGIHCGGADEAVQRFSEGFKLCPIGSDVGMMAAGASSALQVVRKAFPA